MRSKLIVLVACVVLVGCGSKKKDGDADAAPDGVDVMDMTEGVDDPVEDPVEDGEPDGEEDPEVDPVEDPVEEVEDAPPDHPTDCVTGDAGTAPSDLTDACVRMAACIDEDNPRDNAGACLLVSLLGDWQPLYGDWRELLVADGVNMVWDEVIANATCIATATDCDGAFRCLNGDTASPTCTLSDASIAAWPTGCSGGNLTVCVNVDPATTGGREITVPCPGTTTCASVGTGFAGCFTTDCTTAETAPTCRGGNIDQCVAPSMHLVIDCSDLSNGAGGVCEMIDDGTGTGTTVASCRPTGPTCDPSSYTDSCSGDDLMRCELGHEYASDCTDIASGWSCSSTSAECVPDYSSWTCTVTEGGECDCEDLLFCDITAGTDVRLHCPEYGYGWCDDSGSAATCVP